MIGPDLHIWIYSKHLVLGRLDLLGSHVGSVMDYLSLQIAQIDVIAIDNSNRSDPGGGQIKPCRCAETPGADDQHFGGKQFLLTDTANLFQDYVPAVSFYLLLS
jgi:hypothetical protein